MRIGIANDQPMAVEALRRALALRPEYEIAWVARDGAEAVALSARETPDLLLMDLLMPVMGGVEATRRIMAATPCAILVVTVNIGTNAGLVFEAMGHGALDAIDTPTLDARAMRDSARPLLAKIDGIASLVSRRNSQEAAEVPALAGCADRLAVVGASAGGPAALATLLGGMPTGFPAALVIVQHVDEQFAPGLADWLGQHCTLPVRLAREGDALAVGEVLLAGSNDHLVLKADGRLGYTAEPRDYVYRPSVDVFFQSVARGWSGRVVGVLLTGMGQDGALGLKALRDKGHYTIAQDQATSAVYGMPKAAARMEAAVEILPVERIATKLIMAFTGKPGDGHA